MSVLHTTVLPSAADYGVDKMLCSIIKSVSASLNRLVDELMQYICEYCKHVEGFSFLIFC